MQKVKVAVVGGGASGLVAAITAARNGLDVTIFEKNDRIGKKILATGNGRCNFSNYNLSMDCYFCDEKNVPKKIFEKFDTEESIRFFQGLGMLVKDKNGYLYPATETATTVLDLIRYELKECNVKIITEATVKNIVKKNNQFVIKWNEMEDIYDRVILSVGSNAGLSGKMAQIDPFNLVRKCGFTIAKGYPGLGKVYSKDSFFKQTAGVRTDAKLTVLCDEKDILSEIGELQLTDRGPSGIVTFQLSATIADLFEQGKTVELSIDLLPSISEEELENLYLNRLLLFQNRTIEEFFTGIIHKKIIQAFCNKNGISLQDQVSEKGKEAKNMLQQMKKLVIKVDSLCDMSEAQVCHGGVPFREVDDNLQSKEINGLYLCGELLDIDGKCGGYNLQWAWASGVTVGEAVSKA